MGEEVFSERSDSVLNLFLVWGGGGEGGWGWEAFGDMFVFLFLKLL